MKDNVREVSIGRAADSTPERGATERDAPGREAEGEAPADVDADHGEARVSPSESARLELQSTGPGQLGFQFISSPTDEFVRVGEALSLALPALLLWETLYPNDPAPDDARLEQLTATVEVYFRHGRSTIGQQVLAIRSFTSSLYGLYARTARFIIPSRTDALSFEIIIIDAQSAANMVKLGEAKMVSISVFGGNLPQKTLLFDNLLGGVLRQRIIEGGSLSAGAEVLLGYTEWRADQIVDKTAINTQIGLARSNDGAGGAAAPIHGKLVHEVSYGVCFNDTQDWQEEAPLAPNVSSLLGKNRTNFETTLAMPAGAKKMQIYAHVKTYLVADYGAWGDVTEKWYRENDKALMRDKYDTPSGAYTNYEFAVG